MIRCAVHGERLWSRRHVCVIVGSLPAKARASHAPSPMAMLPHPLRLIDLVPLLPAPETTHVPSSLPHTPYHARLPLRAAPLAQLVRVVSSVAQPFSHESFIASAISCLFAFSST